MTVGIRATSTSNPMTSGETTNGVRSGYVTNEAVLLSLVGASPSVRVWSLSTPSGSDSALSSTSIAGPTFIPDEAGDYLVQLDADGTVYTFIAGVVDVARQTLISAGKFPAALDSTVADPTNDALLLYNSQDEGGLVVRDDQGTTTPIRVGPKLTGTYILGGDVIGDGDEVWFRAADSLQDEGSTPAVGCFALAGTTATVSGIAIEDTVWVKLSLTGKILASQTVILTYTKPASNPLAFQTGPGTEIASFAITLHNGSTQTS